LKKSKWLFPALKNYWGRKLPSGKFHLNWAPPRRIILGLPVLKWVVEENRVRHAGRKPPAVSIPMPKAIVTWVSEAMYTGQNKLF
jgi:hypothetical protein